MIIFTDGFNHFRQSGYRIPIKGDYYLDRKGNCIRCASDNLDDERIILTRVGRKIEVTYEDSMKGN